MSKNVIKSFTAGATVEGRRLVKMSDDNTVIKATAATDKIIGVSSAVDAASGGRCDVILSGPAEVLLGDTVTRGNPVVADAAAKGAPATLNASITQNAGGTINVSGSAQTQIGTALASGVVGDIIEVNINVAPI